MKKILVILVAMIGFGISASAQKVEVEEIKPSGNGYRVTCKVRISESDCKDRTARTVQVTCTPRGLNNLVSKATQYQTDRVPCIAKHKSFDFVFDCKDDEKNREQCNLYNFDVNAKFVDE
jgi:hypothetical protein